MVRPPVAAAKKGQWTPDEDIKLVCYVQEHGAKNWSLVPENAGLKRNGKSCRLRWMNHLRPGIKVGKFTHEEERIIKQHHAVLGNRWAAIAAHLSGRTDNDVKNYWYIHLKKKGDKVDGLVDEQTRNPVAPPLTLAPAPTLAPAAAPPIVAPAPPPTLALAATVTCAAPPILAPIVTPPTVTPAAAPIFAPRCVLPTPTSAHASVFASDRAAFDNKLTAPAPSFAPGGAILDYSLNAPAPSIVRGRGGFNYPPNIFIPFDHDQISFGPFSN